MFSRLGRFAACQSWIVCVIWIALGAALTAVAPAWDTQTQDDDVRFVPQRFTSVRAYHLLQKAFPEDVFASRVVFAIEREEAALSASDFQLVQTLAHDLEQLKRDAPELKIGRIESYQSGLIGW